MASKITANILRAARLGRVAALRPREMRALWAMRRSGLFDATYYRGAHPNIHPIYHRVPMLHYVVYGEAMGFRPNPDFSPKAYLTYNPDVEETGTSPFHHYVTQGRFEDRLTKELPQIDELPDGTGGLGMAVEHQSRAAHAIVLHIYYPDLWEEFAAKLEALEIAADIFVTLTYRGSETMALAEDIRARFPGAVVLPLYNRGRDILPFLTLVNAGLLDGYRAIAKMHTKKSPHREDGELWRRHLVDGILPETGLARRLAAFEADAGAAFWVADGQHFTDPKWWGSNFEEVRDLLRRVEIEATRKDLNFPAGSIYWLKAGMIDMLKALGLREEDFERESGQVDGTTAHVLERAIGMLAAAGGQTTRQATELDQGTPADPPEAPAFTTAFYLPQFHPIPENDAWWGKGYTEWRGVTRAAPNFDGHRHPYLPADLGFYDLRVTEVMGQQAALARGAGIDAFCVYHYWFDGRRVLEAPLDRLLDRPEIDFPFYLCWANESWRRNWDGLSGVVLLEQTYAEGFEDGIVASALPYMRDARYARPDGTRPRFVIYRPEDMPEPAASVARMRQAWRAAGVGEVELGAVSFHVAGENAVAEDLFDFWIEMPPHGLIQGEDYLYGGVRGDVMGAEVHEAFEGLIYDYQAAIERSLSPAHIRSLPANTIPGAMPGWDNTARRGRAAHIAHGANPAAFERWLRGLLATRVPHGYRRELFLNAWNEWAEKAVLEPSEAQGHGNLRALARVLRPEAPHG